MSAIKMSAGQAAFTSKKRAGASGTIVVGHRVPVKRGKNVLDARKRSVLAKERGR